MEARGERWGMGASGTSAWRAGDDMEPRERVGGMNAPQAGLWLLLLSADEWSMGGPRKGQVTKQT